MRVTQHNGRTGKDGAYSPKHNDRDFDVGKAEHINADKSAANEYWTWCGDGFSFEEAEAKFYAEHFAAALNRQNEKYKSARQYGRVKTMDDYRTAARTCPEEQITQIGRAGNNYGAAVLRKIAVEQLIWEQQHYPQAVILDVALHVDEAAPHIHARRVWIAHDKDGNEIVSQTKALAEMGIKVEHATRYDNAKKIYTEACRAHLEGLCRSYGITLEDGRLEASRGHLDTLQYKIQQENKKLREEKEELQTAKKHLGYDRIADGNLIANLRKKVAKLENTLRQNGIDPNKRQNGRTPYRGR